MDRIKRLPAVMLCTGLPLCSCTNGSSGDDVSTAPPSDRAVLVGDIPCEFPLDGGNTALNIMTTTHGDIPAEDIYVWNRYEEMTGVDVNWRNIKKSERSEAIHNALVNKADVDLILRGKVTSDRLTQYGESGLIYDLAKDDLLKNNAPNCWAYLQSHPDALASIMNPDGSIYALPQINSGAELRVSRKIFINKDWLENVGMEMPSTTEEFYLLLKAFKEQDANGNGDPNDEIPLCSQDWLSIQEAFFGSFGLANRGVHNLVADLDPDTGKVRLIAASDDYRTYLEYMNRLYSEELLDKFMFTMSVEQWLNNIENDRIGVFANTNLATVPAGKADSWAAVEEALEGPDGDKLWSAIRANFHSTGAAVIPSTCDNPELVLRWLDYFWTDEGTLFYHMGVSGKTYTENADGSYDYAPSIYEQMQNGRKSFDDVVALYSPYPGGGNPTVEIAPYFMGGEMADIPAAAARKLFEYGPEEYWPSFTFTAAENDRLGVLNSDIKKYTDSARVDFITGVKPFSEWDEYISQLDRMGREELLSYYQAAADRYGKLKAEINQ